MDNERLDAEVLISGRGFMNRGMDGDIVAIEILPKVRAQLTCIQAQLIACLAQPAGMSLPWLWT